MKLLLHAPLLTAFLATSAANSQGVDSTDGVDVLAGEADVSSLDIAVEDVKMPSGFLRTLAGKWPEDLVIVPVPAYSPQLGWNLTLGAAYFIGSGTPESGAPPSALGIFAMGAENGSFVYGTGASLSLLGDKLRVKAGALNMDVRYRFYGIGEDLDIGLDLVQEGSGYFANGVWRIWQDLFVGLGYLRGSLDTRFRFGQPETPTFDPTLSLDIGGITIPVRFDSRDHQLFPRSGWLVSLDGTLYRKSVGSDFDANTFKFAANHYLPMRESDVLASRIVIKTATENTPFFLKSAFGGSKDLRGYPSGRYRDALVAAIQTEYRWHLADRWILTGFVGIGEAAAGFDELGRNLLPAGGIGARFVLSAKHRVSLSADLAAGKDGAEFYLGVNEAF